MRKLISIPSELIEYANSMDIDEMLKILWDAVRYRLTWEIVNNDLLELLDPNKRRAEKMKWKQNRLWHTKNKSVTDLNNKSVTHLNKENKSVTDLKISVQHTKNKSVTDLFITDENWLNQTHEESWGFIYSNSILLNIITSYIDNNITYTSINYQINKQWKEKYIESQVEEAEKLIKKIWFQTFQTILQYLPHDDFWSKNILSIAKLNKKNKDGVPYYAVIMDRIKNYTPKVISIPTV